MNVIQVAHSYHNYERGSSCNVRIGWIAKLVSTVEVLTQFVTEH